MTVDPQDDLRAQADRLLTDLELTRRLAPFSFHFTGSFALDALAWPDIDVSLLYSPALQTQVCAMRPSVGSC